MYHIKANSSTVHPFFTERTLRNWKITTRTQLFIFFLSSSRRRRPPVLQAEQRFDQPPTSPFQIKEQTPSIGKLQDILSERPSAVGTLIWPLILSRTTTHPDEAEYSTSSTDKQLRRPRTETRRKPPSTARAQREGARSAVADTTIGCSRVFLIKL